MQHTSNDPVPLKNSPEIWRAFLPVRNTSDHKYKRGSAAIYGAPSMTGATRLAAESCARIGAGLVNVLAPKDIADIYKETLQPHIIVRDNMEWTDERLTARLYGSGGLPCAIDFNVDIPTVLDADALNQDILEKMDEHYVLTPHEGEFKRLFPDLDGTKAEKAGQAAGRTGAIVVYKGAETVIAAPDGRVVLNTHATSDLATAGTGDILAGMITGLLAQGMPPFEAACAAVWMHGEAALRFGAGLVASDIPEIIPEILKDFA